MDSNLALRIMSPLLYQLSYRPGAGVPPARRTLAILRAVSQENVEIVRSLHRAFEAGDRDAWQPRFHPDVEWDVTSSGLPARERLPRARGGPRTSSATGSVHGTTSARRRSSVIDAGDSVVIAFRQWGRGRESGVPVDRHFFGVYDLADGQGRALAALRVARGRRSPRPDSTRARRPSRRRGAARRPTACPRSARARCPRGRSRRSTAPSAGAT